MGGCSLLSLSFSVSVSLSHIHTHTLSLSRSLLLGKRAVQFPKLPCLHTNNLIVDDVFPSRTATMTHHCTPL